MTHDLDQEAVEANLDILGRMTCCIGFFLVNGIARSCPLEARADGLGRVYSKAGIRTGHGRGLGSGNGHGRGLYGEGEGSGDLDTRGTPNPKYPGSGNGYGHREVSLYEPNRQQGAL